MIFALLRHTNETKLSAERARQVLEYRPENGIFRWKFNPERPKEWNTRRAGKTAGYFDKAVGYVIRFDDTLYLGHRLAWLITHGEWPVNELDHRNGKPWDNRIDNLRPANRSQQMQNRAMQSNNTTGYIGVRAHHGKWESRININGSLVWRQVCDTPQEAAIARADALPKFHGEFAMLEPSRKRSYVRPHD